MAKTIIGCGELSPNDKNGPCPDSVDRPVPCWCRKDPQHRGGHECRCGAEWPSKTQRDLADLVERITITEIQPGDVLVFETDRNVSGEEVEAFQTTAEERLPRDVKVMLVECARFAGVIRPAVEPKPKCTRLDCDHKYCVSAKGATR